MIQESILMDTFQSENVRKWDEKLFHYVLSICNARETQFGNKMSDEVCEVSKQKGGKKNQTKLPWPSVTDPWSGREENVNFLHLLVIYLERQEILLRGNFKEPDICCRANTVKHGSLKSSSVTEKSRFVTLKVGNAGRVNIPLNLPLTGRQGWMGCENNIIITRVHLLLIFS